MKMLKKILTYSVGTILCKLVAYILLPIYTNAFDAAVYGEINLSLNTSTMIVSFVFMEMWSAFLRFGYDCNDGNQYKALYTNTLSFGILLIPLFAGATLLFASWQSLQSAGWMILYGVTLFVFNIEQYVCRIKGKQVVYILSGLISSICQLILAFVCLKLGVLRPESIITFPIIGSVIAIIFILIATREHQQFSIKTVNKKYFKEIAAFSFPLSINSVAFWGMTNIGAYIARAVLGPETNGYITVANKFTVLVMLIVSSYSLAWQESAFENSKNPDRGKFYSNQFKIFLDLMTVAIIVITVGIDVIYPYYIGADEYGAVRLILPLYFIASFINSISTFQGTLYAVEKKNNILLFSSLLGCAVSVAAVFALIGSVGVYSVPAGLILGMGANTLMRYAFIKKRTELKVSVPALLISFALIGLNVAAVFLLQKAVFKLALAAVCVIIYCIKWRKTIKAIGVILLKRKAGA